MEVVASAAIAKPKAQGQQNWAEEGVFATLYRFAYFVFVFNTYVANVE